MGFDTSVLLYTPTNPPPRVTTGDLARFVRGFAELGVTRSASWQTVYVQFGDSIDQDDEDTVDYIEAPGTGATIYKVSEIDGDIQRSQVASFEAMAALLDEHSRTVYRAAIGLGSLVPALYERLNQRPREEFSLFVDSVYFIVGLVTTGDLESRQLAHVGWMGLDFSGRGLATPHQTHRELVDQVRSDPDIQRLEAFLHEFWRLPEIRVRRPLAKARQSLGPRWPYDTVDITDPWVWGVSVS